MDLVLKLREIRRLRGLSQRDVARLSGVGEKTISSFETGQRIGALKLAQLKKMLSVYGLTEREFFSGKIDEQVAPWDYEQEQASQHLLDDLRALPSGVQRSLLRNFQLMLETTNEVQTLQDKTPSYVKQNPEWHMLNSRN
jgi:transcriptional regulator with XRE-family HTH domain